MLFFRRALRTFSIAQESERSPMESTPIHTQTHGRTTGANGNRLRSRRQRLRMRKARLLAY